MAEGEEPAGRGEAEAGTETTPLSLPPILNRPLPLSINSRSNTSTTTMMVRLSFTLRERILTESKLRSSDDSDDGDEARAARVPVAMWVRHHIFTL